MSDDLSTEERYERIAAAKVVDLEFLKEAVLASTGLLIEGAPMRIAKGESNAVFDVLLSNSARLIARMHFDPNKRWFEKETAVIRRLAAQGIPVPTVVALEHRVAHNGVYSLCLQQPVEGTPFLDLLNRGALSDASIAQVMDETRHILRRIHSADVSGIDELETANFELVRDVEGYGRYIGGSNAPTACKQAVAKAIRIVRGSAELLRPTPRLVHGDFHPKHIMVADGRLTGVIDLEMAELSDPAKDFAWWNFWRTDADSQDVNYPELLTPDAANTYGPDFADRVCVHELIEGISTVNWYIEQNDDAATTNAARQLNALVATATLRL